MDRWVDSFATEKGDLLAQSLLHGLLVGFHVAQLLLGLATPRLVLVL